jgi:hypothetical protein
VNPDPETIEAIARWLEASALYGQGWQRRHLAADLRSGAWQDQPQRITDAAIILARAEDRIAYGHPVSRVEQIALDQKARRQQLTEERNNRRLDKLLGPIEAYANQKDDQ